MGYTRLVCMTTNSNDFHIKELDTLRFLAIAFVVVNHLGGKPQLYSASIVSHATSPIMACITSYLMYRSIKESNQIFSKLRRRVHSIVVPYFLWTFITYIFIQFSKLVMSICFDMGAFNINHSLPVWSLKEFFVNYVIHPNPGAFWYLQNLILILPFTYVIFYLVKPIWSIGLLIPVLISLYGYDLVPYFSSRFLPYYFFGAWMGAHYSSHIPSVPGNKYALLVFAIFLTSINEFVTPNWGGVTLIINFILQVGLFLLGVSLMRRFCDASIVKFFHSKLHISFYLHAAHSTVITVIQSVLMIGLMYFGADDPYLRLILPLIVFLATFRFIDVLATQMMLRTPNIYNLLSGQRRKK